MPILLAYVGICLVGLTIGLILDARDVGSGIWLIFVSAAALCSMLLPEPRDVIRLAAAALVIAPVVIALKLLGAPEWLFGGALLLFITGVWIVRERADHTASGPLQIPPGHRFKTRRRD